MDDMHCEDVIMMPREMTYTTAMDSKTKLLDIHSHNKFFTFQIPDKNHTSENIVIQRFSPKEQAESLGLAQGQGSDMMFRLRASYHAAQIDATDQGMRVTLTDEDTGQVVVDGSSEDHDERSVHLDSIEISSAKNYILKYEFFEKNVGITSFEDSIVSAGHLGATACSRPFVVAEMVIVAKELVIQRAGKYREARQKSKPKDLGGVEHDIIKLIDHCDFRALDNAHATLERGESGLYCPKRAYTYSPQEGSPDELVMVYHKEFKVEGAQSEPVTYLFDLTLGYEFSTAAQLKAVVSRVDPAHDGEFVHDPLACLLDHSCIETSMTGKNQIGIQAILTAGEYQLAIFDQEENDLRRWLHREAGLDVLPFSFSLEASPVVQNEERAMCGDKLYLSEPFIQHRFIDHMGGQRFTFEDDIILNLVNSTQDITIVPEEDMLLKVTAREAYGVNVAMSLCQGKECTIKGSQSGNVEILYATVKKGREYRINLDYSHSIVELHTFYDCPHIHFKISMMPIKGAEKVMSSQKEKTESWIHDQQADAVKHLTDASELLSRAATIEEAAFMLSGHDQIYRHAAPPKHQFTAQAQSYQVAEQHFRIPNGSSRQVMIEVFFDPQFYEMELLLMAKEESEVRSQLYKARSNVDLSHYKGAKRVFVEAEPGEYTIQILAKLPGIQPDTEQFVPRYIEWQLYALAASSIPSVVLRPPSLNYFGLLGPDGIDFGQVTYLVPDLLLEPREYVDLHFNVSASKGGQRPSIDIQAIEADGKGDQLDLSLNELNEESVHEEAPDGRQAANYVIVKEGRRPEVSKYQDDWEDGVAYEALSTSDISTGALNRIRLANRDPATSVRATLKLVISERGASGRLPSDRQLLPKNFEEVARFKPKVPGVKEGAFIQGSRKVMETFKVTALSPFVPKSLLAYQAEFRTGQGTDDSFMPSLAFEVKEQSNQLYAQVAEYSGREDLFLSIYSAEDGQEGTRQVARSNLGRYSNSLGPVTLPKGQYRLVVHPDQDSTTLARGVELIRFGLDVLVEKPNDASNGGDFDTVVEGVELCSYASLPDDFNGPGFIHPLSGSTLGLVSKYRVQQTLDGAMARFELFEASLVTVYAALPQGLELSAVIEKLSGTRATKISGSDLNKDDESFLRQENGFAHRAVVQVREFLGRGKYVVRLQASETTGVGTRLMPRCEAFSLGLSVSPLANSAAYPLNAECESSKYIPEHLSFDEPGSGKLWYPTAESTIDVAYLDLKKDGEGPFLFHFSIQHDPRLLGVLGLSLSRYDEESTSFKQTSLWRSPQDGLVQILAVVESGVYAVGIQTLTSTDTMFLDAGLGAKARQTLGGKLLPASCLEVSYSYLVVSTLAHDSRTLEGGPLGLLSLLAGGGLSKIVNQVKLDRKLLDELGDATIFGACTHDDLPASLATVAAGFDRSFTLLTQQKPADYLDMVVEVPSLLRVSIHTRNEKNRVSAYLLEHPDDREALAWTKGSGNSASFVQVVQPGKRAYALKLVYDTLDELDPCPTFDFRVILKPVEAALAANLECQGDGLPPLSVDITDDDFALTGRYAFSRDFIHKVTDKGGDLQYDIALNWPNAADLGQYYLDVETSSDVLTGQMTFTVLYQKPDKSMGLLGRSHPEGSTAHEGRFVQRLKRLDRAGDLAEDVDVKGAVLRLRFPPSSIHLVDDLIDQGHLGTRELCHTFQLSIRAESRPGENEGGEDPMGPSRLLRVRWVGDEASAGLFDHSKRVTAVLEFDRSMKAAFKILKTTGFANLVAAEPHVSAKQAGSAPDPVAPAAVRLSADDPSVITLEFPGGSLARGWCQKLTFSGTAPGTGPDWDDGHLGKSQQICASNCLCHWRGTASCMESKSKCLCAFPYVGTDCSQCRAGYALDAATGECSIASTCAEQGGTEKCNSHGRCEQVGPHARCHCDAGFGADGEEQCGRCTDPLFRYPDCQVRQLVLEEPDVNCADLAPRMPAALWQDGPRLAATEKPVQTADGVINWGLRYRLQEGKTLRKTSTHSFLVPATLVFRLHLDTSRSGVLVKYRLVTDRSEVVLSSASAGQDADEDGYVGQASEFVVVHGPTGRDPAVSPYRLELEYKHAAEARANHQDLEQCPSVDIRVVAEPLETAREALKCSEGELSAASIPRQTKWDFDSSSKVVEDRVTLLSDETELFKSQGRKKSHFATLRYTLDVRGSGNALSILTTYPFSAVDLSMSLYDGRTGALAATERSSSLEGDRGSGTALSATDDMATYLEVAWLDAGRYRLEIQLRRSLFLPTRQYPTCLSFGLVAEYVARPAGAANTSQYQVLAVVPLHRKAMDPQSEMVVEVLFDKPLALDDLVESHEERFYVCSLVNIEDANVVIHPKGVRIERGSTLRLDFDFAHTEIPAAHRCYKLACSTQESKGEESIQPMTAETNYCFATPQEAESNALSHCNPHARPKLGKDGKCICASPYTGQGCYDCQTGFKAEPVGLSGRPGKPDTICVPDLSHLERSDCNGHGRPKSRQAATAAGLDCDCDTGYGGQSCDYCLDTTLAYPDCSSTSDFDASIYDAGAAAAFLARRQYDEHGYSTAATKYFPAGALEPKVFNEECGWVDFPDDLDRTEYSKEFKSGEFHIADVYVVNHRQDNIMKFVPRSTGTLKVLLQQPEAEEALAGTAEAPFDIEIGIYDAEAQRFLASGMNHHLILPSGSEAKLERAALSFEVRQEHLGRPLYVFFRALNFTDEGTNQGEREGCLALYLEAEFKAAGAECGRFPNLDSSTYITTLADGGQASLQEDAAKGTGEGAIHSIQDVGSTFFTYRDFYVPAQSLETDADWEVTISLQQKFIESNTLDVVVEVLATDVQFNEINTQAYSPSRLASGPASSRPPGLGTRHRDTSGTSQTSGSLGPSCRGLCLIGGEKAFNEVLRRLELGAGTYFRVWLLQDKPESRADEARWCANYQLLVSGRQLHAPGQSDALGTAGGQGCEAVELPASLNSHRYLLGLEGGQKDFHFRESYRVDHLWHNQAHKVAFKLTEPSVVRIVAPIHKHLDFVLSLNQEVGPYSHKTVLTARKEDYHSTIFAQLAAGDYHLKFSFVSDAALLQLPCQTVQLEMAIMTVTNAKAKAERTKAAVPAGATSALSLSQLFLSSASSPVTLHRPHALGWRHVEPGLQPSVDQGELYFEILREGFEISEEDEAGLDIELQSDFLLQGVNVAISNVATGAILEDERTGSTSKLIVGRLQPGAYELILYTHECATNMDPEHGVAITSFDILLTASITLLRERGAGESGGRPGGVSVDILEFSSSSYDGGAPRVKESKAAVPLQLTPAELSCRKQFLPLPSTFDSLMQSGSLDFSETFYVPTSGFFTQEIAFTIRQGQEALRVVLARANAKLTVLDAADRKVVAQSRPSEAGRAQLLAEPKLRADKAYILVLELSADGGLDGLASVACEHFLMAVKTWDAKKTCQTGNNLPDATSLPSSITIGSEPFPQTVVLDKRLARRELRVEGSGIADLTITIDYSDAYYATELTLRAATGDSVDSLIPPLGKDGDGPDAPGVLSVMQDLAPDRVDFSRKQATTYHFQAIGAGTYQIRLLQRFKGAGCGAALTLTASARPASEVDPGQPGRPSTSLTLFQSQAEEQEAPRTASQLPLSLDTLKFAGGVSRSGSSSAAGSGSVLFSAPVQLGRQESDNRMTFTVERNGTLLRVYCEHEGVVLSLIETSAEHPKPIAAGAGVASLATVLPPGKYEIKFAAATAHARSSAAVEPPRALVTVLLAHPDQREAYTQSWATAKAGRCEGDANFPLALRQQKQLDPHQLFYSYPLIKVSPTVLATRPLLQTYHFRVNVTSRVYFEVGMHMLNSHVTLQMTTLGGSAHPIQGKQRGNLNVLDIQVGPGDYTIAIKQAAVPGSTGTPSCGLFSLQGLVEPIDLMSAAANSGEILQRGIMACPEAADGDVLPSKIYGSKSRTRGGGELHVDASGHFMRRFRNVLFKLSREYSADTTEYDFVELEPAEDSLLHLNFLYDAKNGRGIKVTVTDTWMMGATVKPQAAFKLNDVEGGLAELVTEYKLTKGRHYALTVLYLGGAPGNALGAVECATYDVTVSIAHVPKILEETTCKVVAKGKAATESLSRGLTHVITDRQLDKDGLYSFDKVLQLQYPQDFKKVSKVAQGVGQADVLLEQISIDLSSTYDLRASVDFEFDQGLFTLHFTESAQDEAGQWQTDVSHEQSPLTYKRNNDHYRTVRRELVAEGVESRERTGRHTLTIANREPDLLHLLDASRGEACLYVVVKISIRATQKSAGSLYSANAAGRVARPVLEACRPDESPAFVHGRPRSTSFELIFNARPYLRHHEPQERADPAALKEAIHLKAATVSLADGKRTEILLKPSTIVTSSKEYQSAEYHVTADFDLSQFEHTATEKLVHAQLVVLTALLVDEGNRPFETSLSLAHRGLPLYVFEANDQEQLFSEESSEVREALQGTEAGREAERLLAGDLAIETSDLETELQAQEGGSEVECLCVHGKCRDGEAECSGRCDEGWNGRLCNVPTDTEALRHVNHQQRKDYTGDGLYRPQAILDQGAGGSSRRREAAGAGSSDRASSTRPQRIESDSYSGPGYQPHSTALQEQLGHLGELSAYSSQTQATEAQTQNGEASDDQEQSYKRVGMLVLVAFVLYILLNGLTLPTWLGFAASQRRYKPVGRFDREQDSDDEAEDPLARRRMMELSSFGAGREQEAASQPQGTAPDYQESRQPQNQRGSFPMASFASSSSEPQAPGYEDEAAAQLQRELELFAQDEGEDEEVALINLGDRPGEPQNSDDREIQEFETYFDNR